MKPGQVIGALVIAVCVIVAGASLRGTRSDGRGAAPRHRAKGRIDLSDSLGELPGGVDSPPAWWTASMSASTPARSRAR